MVQARPETSGSGWLVLQGLGGGALWLPGNITSRVASKPQVHTESIRS